MYKIAICFLLILSISALSKFKKINIEKNLITAFLHSVAQILLLSLIILKLFQLSSFYTFIALFFMGLAGALIADKHGNFIKGTLSITLFSVYISSFSVIALMLVLKVIENKAMVLLPLGGMVIGNAMNSISLAYDRLKNELQHGLAYMETMLSLGFSEKEAYEKLKKNSIKSAMIPKINNMKALGLVWIPGLMAGMILGGANPVTAAMYQLIIIVMIVVSSFISSVIVIETARKKILNKRGQIIAVIPK